MGAKDGNELGIDEGALEMVGCWVGVWEGFSLGLLLGVADGA